MPTSPQSTDRWETLDFGRYTASVTSSGGWLYPRIKLPSRVVQFHLVALLVTIPSTGWRT